MSSPQSRRHEQLWRAHLAWRNWLAAMSVKLLYVTHAAEVRLYESHELENRNSTETLTPTLLLSAEL